MNLPFELRVALRYLQARRKAGISLTSFLTVAGVMLGVAALVVVTSVWNGFEAEFLAKLLGVNAHSVVLRRFDVFRNHAPIAEALQKRSDVVAVQPFVYSEVIVQSARGVQGVAIKGVDPEQARDLPVRGYVARTGAEPDLVFDALDRSHTSTVPPGMILGKDLKDMLHVDVGDTVSVVSPYGGEEGRARNRPFRVAGFFHSGMFEFDSRMVFVGLGPAQDFFDFHDTITGLEIWTVDATRSKQIVERAVQELSPEDPLVYDVKDWSVTNRGVFGAVNQQKTLITLVLGIIVIVAAFNIMATLILLILDKRREIALLKSIGASDRSILAIFVIDGQLVGMAGCVMGIGLGLVLCKGLGRYGLQLDPRIYYLENLPVVVSPWEVFVVVAGAMLASTVATLFPAWTAARMNPAEGLARQKFEGRSWWVRWLDRLRRRE